MAWRKARRRGRGVASGGKINQRRNRRILLLMYDVLLTYLILRTMYDLAGLVLFYASVKRQRKRAARALRINSKRRARCGARRAARAARQQQQRRARMRSYRAAPRQRIKTPYARNRISCAHLPALFAPVA